MSILTKSGIRSLKSFVSINKPNTTASPEAAYVFLRFSDALDTIDALEAERAAMEARLEAVKYQRVDVDTVLESKLHNLENAVMALEVERDEWIHRAEAAEATQDAVAMMLANALDAFSDEYGVTGETWVARAAMRCPPVEEARERTRKAAEAFDQILHASGRCTCHGEGQCEWCSKECEMCGAPRGEGCGCDTGCLGCVESQRTISALEAERGDIKSTLANHGVRDDDASKGVANLALAYAGATARLRDVMAERDALKTDLHLWQKTSSSLHAQEDWMAGMIKSIAKTNQNTHTIAWSPAALREILAVIEGGESDDSIRRVTCKCINGGETTINWSTGCGETLCHAELIDDGEGDQ